MNKINNKRNINIGLILIITGIVIIVLTGMTIDKDLDSNKCDCYITNKEK